MEGTQKGLVYFSIEYGEGNGTSLQYSCLENPMDEGAWWAAVHEVAKSRTQLSDFTSLLWYIGASLVAQIVKHLPKVWETWDLIPYSGRSYGEGTGYPLQYSCLENSMNREA